MNLVSICRERPGDTPMEKDMKNRLMKKVGRYLLREELEDLRQTLQREVRENTSLTEEVEGLYKKIESLQEAHRKPPTKVVIRLTRGEYDRLRSQLQPNMVTSSTTQLEAAYLVGQQRVLDILEKGFVSDA